MKILSSVSLILLVLCFPAFSQLSGPLSGILGPGTYTVTGDVWVENGDSLTILPATTLSFQAGIEFDIFGYLYAVGEPSPNSIYFSLAAPMVYWGGIDFNDSSDDNSRMEHCLVSYADATDEVFPYNGGGGIFCNNASPTIANSIITENKADWGGGICCNGGAAPLIDNCTISNNLATSTEPYGNGGGIFCYDSAPTITNCLIEGNVADSSGGGIQCTNSPAIITNCTFNDNSAMGSPEFGGGGLGLYNSDATITDCEFNGNEALLGGGITSSYDNSEISNCTISGNISNKQGGGIYLSQNSNAIINNCTFNNNEADSSGGGICVTNSSPQIIDCTINNNNTGAHGGGITCRNGGNTIIDNCIFNSNVADSSGGGIGVGYDASAQVLNSTITNCTAQDPSAGGGGIVIFIAGDVLISNCTINNNTATFGGGIINGYSNPMIEFCDISGNTADYGGGIYTGVGGITIKRCTIANNSASYDGGGIDMTEINPIIENCTFSGNQADRYGSQIDVWENAAPQITNTIVEGNSTNSLVYFYYLAYVGSYTYNDFHNSVGNNFEGTVPTGLGIITGVNANGDPCDDYMNIFEDPHFVYPLQNDYRLSWGSACIDAGDPVSPLDPDGTCCDMGAFCYDQSMPVRLLLTPFDTPIEIPALGGSFDYAIQVTNIEPTSFPTTIWCEVTLPDGTSYGPLLGPVVADLGTGITISRDRTQNIPAGAPSGMYTYHGFAVAGGNLSSDSFTFVKLAADGSDWYSGWFNTGEDFGEFGGVALADNLPTEYALNSPYPNPFNPSTNISYQLAAAGHVGLTIYDIMGHEITRLIDEYKTAGLYEITFDAKDLVSGVYFVRLEAREFSQVQKVVLMK